MVFDVEVGRLGEVDGFGEALHDAGDADLVDHLRELPRARRAPGGRSSWRRTASPARPCGEALVVAADHDGQRTVLRASLTAGHRRIEKVEAEGNGLFRSSRATPAEAVV